MNKKFQVFLSSTYSDLKLERQAAVEAILLAGHIPAGMELFSAGDEAQLDVIRRWIQDSDIFMLVLGGRYGSLDPKSGRSYIELEYEHAVMLSKPLFALVLSDEGLKAKCRDLGDTARESERRSEYDKFKERVLSKVSRLVDDGKDVKLYTVEAIRNIEQRHELVGWVRGDDAVDVQPFLAKISQLTAQNSELSDENRHLQALSPQPVADNLADLGDTTTIRIDEKATSQSYIDAEKYKLTWGEIFELLGPKLMEHPHNELVKTYLKEQILSKNEARPHFSELNEQDFQSVKIQLEALGLIETQYRKSQGGGMQLYWTLTAPGRTTLTNRRAAKKPSK